jgi:hypothetical protein
VWHVVGGEFLYAPFAQGVRKRETDEVSDKSTIDCPHGRCVHLRVAPKHSLDLGGFDAHAIQLELAIETPKKNQRAIRTTKDAITRPINALPPPC